MTLTSLKALHGSDIRPLGKKEEIGSNVSKRKIRRRIFRLCEDA